MEFFVISMLNGLSYGLLLFMLSSGLTLIFSMMGVLNFAHASFYMLGAYFGYTLSGALGFWLALFLAPVLTGAAGALFESQVLRKVHKMGHVSELLVTFGLSYVVLEVVQLVWAGSLSTSPRQLFCKVLCSHSSTIQCKVCRWSPVQPVRLAPRQTPLFVLFVRHSQPRVASSCSLPSAWC